MAPGSEFIMRQMLVADTEEIISGLGDLGGCEEDRLGGVGLMTGVRRVGGARGESLPRAVAKKHNSDMQICG